MTIRKRLSDIRKRRIKLYNIDNHYFFYKGEIFMSKYYIKRDVLKEISEGIRSGFYGKEVDDDWFHSILRVYIDGDNRTVRSE